MKSLRKLTQNPSFLLLNCLNVDTISTKLQFSEGGGYIFMAKKKKGKKISTKMLSAMLPVLILGMAVLGAVSVFSSKQIIDDEIGKEMTLSLENEKTEVESQMQSAASLAKHMAGIVGITYENEELLAYVNFLNTMIYEEDFIYGAGIYFAPNKYDSKQRFVGPYVYKDGDTPILTYDRSQSSYDYVSRDFYKIVSNGETEPKFTKAYHDEVLDCDMVNCSAPMYSADGTYMGCVTVDITLDEIQNLVSQMSVGKTGKAFLISSDGTYLYTQDSGKIMNEKIVDSKNSSLAKVGTKMLDSDSGKACFTEGITGYTVYYETIPDLDWKLGIAIENSELNAPVISLGIKLAIIAAVILIIMILVILSQVKSVSRQINRVKNFAVQLAEGNFKVQSLESRRSDELGAMGQSLNEMYGNNKDMISKISGHAKLLSDSSIELKRSVEELKKDYEMIESLMNQVNSDMTSSSAATEEVNAAVEEVNSSVNMLASETEKSLELAGEIKKRANGIEDTSRNAYELANKLAAQNRAGLEKSIKNADVVKSIGALAEVISEIADQINLLSLNASIEAARAGEQGKGFAVVAGEIGNLAGETTAAVNKIKETIGEVEHAFSGIVEQSQSMLNFVTDTVAPDYDTFVNVAQQYGDDAQAIEKFSNDIAQMATNIETIIHEVSQAVSSVAESSQNTVDNSGQIMQSVNSVSAVVGEVSEMSSQQEKIAGELKEVVGKFVL